MRPRLLAALLLAVLSSGGGATAAAQSAAVSTGPTLVVLVRHAERAQTPAGDVDISDIGKARAGALADALSGMKPDAIIVSSTRRTAQTAAPVAEKYGITPQVVSLDGGAGAHVAAVANAVKQAKGVVLVVGHSNTVPAIIGALGGPKLADLCEASYATFFVLQPAASGGTASLIRAQYGAPDPPSTPACATMTPPR